MAANRWFSFDGDCYQTHPTEQDARSFAEQAIEDWAADCRENQGWADEASRVAWGEIIEHAEAVPDDPSDLPEGAEGGVDYRLARFVTETRALTVELRELHEALSASQRTFVEMLDREQRKVATAERLAEALRAHVAEIVQQGLKP